MSEPRRRLAQHDAPVARLRAALDAAGVPLTSARLSCYSDLERRGHPDGMMTDRLAGGAGGEDERWACRRRAA